MIIVILFTTLCFLQLNYQFIMTNTPKVYTLKNSNDIEINFIAKGGRILSILVPDKNGTKADVVIGYQTVEEAINGDGYAGALCGRFSNRIANGKFEIDGKQFHLECNNDKNHLHGGVNGFHTKDWDVEIYNDEKYTQAYKLSITSLNGEENYPGELKINVIYGLTENNEFVITYTAETDAPTLINLTSHAYFNLKGAGTGNIENHELELKANKFTPLSAEIGTVDGSIAGVQGTAFDFTTPKKVGLACNSDEEQVQMVEGIDHNFVIDNFNGEVKLAAILKDPDSGRMMEVYTDQPGIQVYTGSHFDGSEIGKLGKPIIKRAGIALETQIFPDSPNHESFPNAILRPGEEYRHVCVYKFV